MSWFWSNNPFPLTSSTGNVLYAPVDIAADLVRAPAIVGWRIGQVGGEVIDTFKQANPFPKINNALGGR